MPVVSTAVGAIAIASVTTTVATVSAAVVAVAGAIGTLGLATTAVGMVTGNKGLLKAGKIMGYVGLAGGIAGYGVGGLFAEQGFAGMHEALGNVYNNGFTEGRGVIKEFLGLTPPSAPMPGIGGAPGTIGGTPPPTIDAATLTSSSQVPTIDVAGPYVSPIQDTLVNPPGSNFGLGNLNFRPEGVPVDQTAYVSTQASAATVPAPAPPPPPAAPTTSAPLADQDMSKMLPVNPSQPTYIYPEAAAAPTSSPGWFASLAPGQQIALLAGGTATAGLLQGVFPGMAAEEANDRAWELQRWQQANASHAPYRSFTKQPVAPAGARPGLLNTTIPSIRRV